MECYLSSHCILQRNSYPVFGGVHCIEVLHNLLYLIILTRAVSLCSQGVAKETMRV